jgi:hypothetical protein
MGTVIARQKGSEITKLGRGRYLVRCEQHPDARVIVNTRDAAFRMTRSLAHCWRCRDRAWRRLPARVRQAYRGRGAALRFEDEGQDAA